MRLRSISLYILITALYFRQCVTETKQEFQESNHTNNWAVLIAPSRGWYNYHQLSNTLEIYWHLKRLGMPNSHIIVMLADDMSCNPRNPFPGLVFSHLSRDSYVYDEDVEIDYRATEVTIDTFLRVLTGHLPHDTPRSKRLLSNEGSNILIVLNGHGDREKFKFQDVEELSGKELADALNHMHLKRRYNEILLILDTCKAASMYEKLYSPNILALATSKADEGIWQHDLDETIGVFINDDFTINLFALLEDVKADSNVTIADLSDLCSKNYCNSTIVVRSDLYNRDPRKVRITDFFSSKRNIAITTDHINIVDIPKRKKILN